MSIFNDKALKSVAEAAAKIMAETSHELKGNQHKIDANKNGKVDAHDFKLLRAGKKPEMKKEEVELDEAKTQSKDEKDKVVGAVTKAMRQSYANVMQGRNERAAARMNAKIKKNMKEESELDEAFPTVADGEKSLKAKEGKTTHGKITKTKTGMKHERDYDDQPEPEVKRGRGRPKKRLSEMRQEYLQFMEEVDNETFTKELKDQKAKFDGKKKGADVAKPAVQAVKQEEYEADDGALSEEQLDELSKSTVKSYVMKKMEKPTTTKKDVKGMTNAYNRLKGYKPTSEEVEQIDEISKELAGKYLTAPQGKGANKYKVSADKSVYPNYDAMSKHDKSVGRALKRSGGSALNKKPSYYKEDVQMDEVAPPGREDQVKALKKVPGIDNPYAVSWASYRKSHPKKSKE